MPYIGEFDETGGLDVDLGVSVMNGESVYIGDATEPVLIYGKCPFCSGLFAVDSRYINDIDNVVHCPMCCMEVLVLK